jgi:hypothetical protein
VPFLPTALTRMGISYAWQPPLAATWTAARFFTFLLLERWHGWHGRWYPALAGVVFLLGGFALTVAAPQLGGAGTGDDVGAGGVLAVVLGLGAFGTGMATIYAGALYYAMEVGRAEVAAGGMHEALIGIGYTAGPLCGLAAVGAVSAGVVAPGLFDPVMLGLVLLIAGSATILAVWWSWRAVRGGTRTQTER